MYIGIIKNFNNFVSKSSSQIKHITSDNNVCTFANEGCCEVVKAIQYNWYSKNL